MEFVFTILVSKSAAAVDLRAWERLGSNSHTMPIEKQR